MALPKFSPPVEAGGFLFWRNAAWFQESFNL
jgi:hypothetical protein